MIYRLIDKLHTLVTRRKVKKLSRDLDELTGGDREQKMGTTTQFSTRMWR